MRDTLTTLLPFSWVVSSFIGFCIALVAEGVVKSRGGPSRTSGVVALGLLAALFGPLTVLLGLVWVVVTSVQTAWFLLQRPAAKKTTSAEEREGNYR